MANYRLKAAGNTGTLATWQDDSAGSYQDSTTLPTVGDICYANGFTGTLNADIAVDSLRTTAATNVNAGGKFLNTVNATREIIANIVAGSTPCLEPNNSGTLNVYGNIQGGTSANAAGINMIFVNSTLNHVGDIIGGSGSGADGVRCSNNNGVTINSTGNRTADVGMAINITDRTPTMNLVGTDTASLTASSTTCRDLTYNGIATSSSGMPAIVTNSILGIINFRGRMVNVQGRMAVYAQRLYIDPTSSTVWTFQKPDNTDINLYTEDAFDYADVTDTRDGVTYANGTKTGTLKVPAPSLVVKDVPIDDTVGSWAFDANLITRLENSVTEDYLTTQLGSLTP